MRVWDSLFCEGPKILFRVALALLKLYEDKILSVHDAGATRHAAAWAVHGCAAGRQAACLLLMGGV